MKKIIALLLFFSLCSTSYAVNQFYNEMPNLPEKFFKLVSTTDLSELVTALRGDTVQITFEKDPNKQGVYKYPFIYMQPDTVWYDNGGKKPKKPKKYKHYYCNYIFLGYPTNKLDAKGAPWYDFDSFSDREFVIDSYNATRGLLYMTDVLTGRKIVYTRNQPITIKSSSLSNQISSLYPDYVYFRMHRAMRNQLKRGHVTFELSIQTYDVWRDSYSSFIGSTVVKKNNSKLLVITNDSYANTFEYSEPRAVGAYEFVSADEGSAYFAELDAKAKEEEAARILQEQQDLEREKGFFSIVYVKPYDVEDYTSTSSMVIAFAYNYIARPYGEYDVIYKGKSYRLLDVKTRESTSSIASFGPKYEDDAFLKRRGESGVDVRRFTALKMDSINQDMILQYQIEKEALNKSKMKEFNQKKIFLIGKDFIHGEYSKCGVRMTFYNCFGKDIKYINFVCQSLNKFNDPQNDELGNTKKESRCIGPIEIGSDAYFNADDLFWDKKGVIRNVKITYIKITFMDNSELVYSGWDKIKPHFEEYSF